MLSFLQQRLGKSPIKSERNTTRQDTIESAFARVNVRNASTDISEIPSLTTATSSTDTSSEPTDSSEKPENHAQHSELPQMGSEHERNMQTQYQDQVTHKLTADSSFEGGDNDSHKRLLHQGVQVLHEDWDLGAMPGDNLGSPLRGGAAKKRKSTRLGFLDQASKAMGTTTSVLGKRRREVVEAGVDKFQDLKGAKRRSAMQPANQSSTCVGGPKKRTRFTVSYYNANAHSQLKIKTKTAKKGSKHWIDQGLYVGQLPGFNPKLKETKNKLNKGSDKNMDTKKSTFMPLPMFAGEKTLAQGRDFKLPFDIFSPLPPGQPKPDEWKKTHKSMLDLTGKWRYANGVQMYLLGMLPTFGRRRSQWSTHYASANQRMVVTSIVSIDSCFTNVMTAIVISMRIIVQIVLLQI